jgi:hypothetical protein
VASAEEIQLADRKIERQKERLDKLQGERDLCLARHRELVFSRPTITEKRDSFGSHSLERAKLFGSGVWFGTAAWIDPGEMSLSGIHGPGKEGAGVRR